MIKKQFLLMEQRMYKLRLKGNTRLLMAYFQIQLIQNINLFLDQIKQNYFELPKYIVADAGCGSEQNYDDILSNRGREALITYNMYLKEQKKKQAQFIEEEKSRVENEMGLALMAVNLRKFVANS